jgi:hypothetical protein
LLVLPECELSPALTRSRLLKEQHPEAALGLRPLVSLGADVMRTPFRKECGGGPGYLRGELAIAIPRKMPTIRLTEPAATVVIIPAWVAAIVAA